MSWFKNKLRWIVNAFKSCLAIDARGVGQQDSNDPCEVTERLVVHNNNRAESLNSNRVSFLEVVGPAVSSLDVAPVSSARPLTLVSDFALAGAGESGAPSEEEDAERTPTYTSNHGEFVADPDSIEPSVDRQLDLPAREPRRKAVLIGVLYTTDEGWETLRTPYEDVQKMKAFLLKNGYLEEYIKILSDCKRAERMGYGIPNLGGIREALGWLIEDAVPGDHLFLHYSGHGHQVVADNYLESDGLDEVIVPLHANGEFLKDNELHTLLVDPLPIGCRLMTVFDCCHAGTMLDLKYEHELHRNGTPQTTPGGHTNRCEPEADLERVIVANADIKVKWAITPRKTYPQMANHVKVVKTVRRSSTSATRSSSGTATPRASEPVLHPGSTIVSVVHIPASSQRPTSHEPSLQHQQADPPCDPTVTDAVLSVSPTESSRPGDVGADQPNVGFPWVAPRADVAGSVVSPESQFEQAHMLRHASTIQDLMEGLNFFTPKTINGRSHTFSQFNSPPEESAQVISIAACHDHEVVFESYRKPITGGLLTDTFIDFMERDSEKKTLDDMIVFLSHAFIRETKEVHSKCRPCNKKDCSRCKLSTAREPPQGQCVNGHCSIPTSPPTPLIATLTEKRRQTLIVL